MATLPIDGIPSTFLTPDFFDQINFAMGQSTQSAGPRSVIFVMPKSSSGTAQVNQRIQIRTEGDASVKAGPGSPAHRAIRKFLQVNKQAKVFLIPYAETSGGSPVSADGYITFTGTATGSGSASVTVAGLEVSCGIRLGQTPAQIATAVAGAINSNTFLPVVASVPSTGKVKLTAKVAGKSQGDGTTGVIRFRASVTTSTGCTVAASGAALGLGFGLPGVDGSTTEAANLLAALNVIASVRDYYVAVSVWDATSLASVKQHLVDKASPNPGLRSVGIGAHTGAAATAQALATTLNYERFQFVNQPNSEHDVAELVGWTAGHRQARESVDAAFNFNGTRDSNILAVYDVTDYLDANDQNDMLTDGISPIASDANGAFLVKSVSTRSKSANGTVNDQRAAETHRPSVMDQMVDEIAIETKSMYYGFKVKPDTFLANGQVNPNQKLPPKVLTPSKYRPLIISKIRDYDARGLIKLPEASIDALDVHIDPNNAGRIEVGLNVAVIDWLNQFTLAANEVSSG